MQNDPTHEAPSLLLVDDDAVFRQRLAQAFSKRGYDVQQAGSHEEAVALAHGESPEYAVVDLRLPDQTGLHVVRDLLAIDEQTKAVVLTGYGSIATALEAVRLGAVHYLQKPVTVDDLIAAFHRAPEGNVDASIEVPSLARAEWEHIQRVLSDCGGSIRQAAKLLRLHRRTLQRKLAKHPGK